MSRISNRSPYALPILFAGAVLALLAGSLAFRAFGAGPAVRAVPAVPAPAAGPTPPSAAVPAPEELDLGAIEMPCWSCPGARNWPIESRSDLDLIAPLGDGDGDAGQWLTHPRWKAAAKRLVRGTGSFETKLTLAPDDPFLRASEPWFDQAKLSLYPHYLPFEGVETPIPNYLVALALARSWIARGEAARDPEQALEDFRRVVRMGRLLRQEDLTVISDLVGIAAIRLGTQAIYDRARSLGDRETALAAAVALSELAPQRYLTSDRITRFDLLAKIPAPGGKGPEIGDALVRELLKAAETGPERRFRLEALTQLASVVHWGSASQKEMTAPVLERLQQDADPFVASHAAWAGTVQAEELRRLAETLSETC